MEPYDRNIPFNQLPPLPPETDAYLDEEVRTKLIQASRRLAELKGLASTLPNQSLFVNTIALREAKASSAIENIFTTDDELYRSLSYQESDYLDGPAKEILHYREALWKGFQDISREGELTVDALIDIYREVKRTRDGIRPVQHGTDGHPVRLILKTRTAGSQQRKSYRPSRHESGGWRIWIGRSSPTIPSIYSQRAVTQSRFFSIFVVPLGREIPRVKGSSSLRENLDNFFTPDGRFRFGMLRHHRDVAHIGRNVYWCRPRPEALLR